MAVDVHAHHWINEYLDMIAGPGKADNDTQRGMGAGDGDDLEDRLDLMRRSGVDIQILSVAPQMAYSDDVRPRSGLPVGTKTPEKPSVAAHRMCYDSMGQGHIPAIQAAVKTYGADRVLLGTDFPYESGDIFTRAVTYLKDGLDESDARAVLQENVARLYGDLIR